jgi:outer membrane protein, heavy metal efflux system
MSGLSTRVEQAYEWLRYPLSRGWLHKVFCYGFFALLSSLGCALDITGPRDELTLNDAIAAALQRNPALHSANFELRIADARIQQAGMTPSPEFSVQLENVAGSGRVKGTEAAEATFMLSQVIELGDKRARRAQAASAGRSLLATENSARQLDILAEVTRRFIHVAADQEDVQLTARATTLAEKTLAEVEKRVRAAKSPAVELHRARIALTRARVDEEHTEHELQSSRRKLAAMWGATKAEFGQVSTALFVLPQPDSFAALLVRLKANPDFTRFASEQRLRDAELRLAETRRVPNVQVGAGIRQLQENNDHAFVLSFSMPLFTGNRSSGLVAEATAQREKVSVDERSAFIRAQAQLFEIYQELQHSLTEARILRDEILPQTESILQQSEYAYQRGRYSYLEWIAAQRELLDAQRSLIEASANAHRYFAEIERLTGEALAANSAE